MESYNDNNIVKIAGRVVIEPEFSHELFEEKFYIFYIETNRLSDYTDKLPVIISERLVDISNIKNGDILKIEGQFRSYNKVTDGKSKLVLSIFVKNVEEVQDEEILTLKDDGERLEADIKRHQDPEYRAKYVREKYLYSRDGELILRIIE